MHGRSKTAGSTIVHYEVQPPNGTQWFGDKAEVDAMVNTLRTGDYELHASFGSPLPAEVTIPPFVYTVVPEDNNDDDQLMLVIIAFAAALVVLVGVAVMVVLYYRRRALRRSFNSRAAAAVREEQSLDERETRALYAVRHTCKTARPTRPYRPLPALSLSLSLCAGTLGHRAEPSVLGNKAALALTMGKRLHTRGGGVAWGEGAQSPTASSSRSPAAKVHPTPERYDEGDDRI
jgi:hypothetical protein